MKKTQWIVVFGLALLGGMMGTTQIAHAGKIDDVKKAVKEKCGKTLSDSEVMDAALKAFDCNPSADVVVGDCTLKCLKSGGGAVVGDK